jgi:hypothetical protein
MLLKTEYRLRQPKDGGKNKNYTQEIAFRRFIRQDLVDAMRPSGPRDRAAFVGKVANGDKHFHAAIISGNPGSYCFLDKEPRPSDFARNRKTLYAYISGM